MSFVIIYNLFTTEKNKDRKYLRLALPREGILLRDHWRQVSYCYTIIKTEDVILKIQLIL